MFIGESSGISGTASNSNTFVGTKTGTSTTSDENTFIGFESGRFVTTGASNTFIGRYSGRLSTTYSDSIAIGNEAEVDGDNQLSIGSSTSPINTAGSAGSISTYLEVKINGTDYKIALYALS